MKFLLQMSILKRFRPSTDSICSHFHCVETPCSIPCAHCSRTFCLRHLIEHQTTIDAEQKRIRSTIEFCRERLSSLNFVDCRAILVEQIDRWTNEMCEKGEKMKKQIEKVFDETQNEFYSKKNEFLSKDSTLTTIDDRQVSRMTSIDFIFILFFDRF